VPSYLVEAYVPRTHAGMLAQAVIRAREAAERLAVEGRRIRFVRSTFVPSDELCFLTFEAESAAVVGEMAERAEIEFERIVEAIE
jgi:hypothetical protein